MATTQKAAAPAAKKTSSVGIKDAIWVIVLCAAIAFCNFFFNFGQAANFEGGDAAGAPLNIWGTIYKGGVIVPVIHTLQHCAQQGGSVANVVRATITAYKEADAAQGVKKEVKIARIQAAHEEAIAVEMPTLTMNLPLIATIVTLGTLTGLLGTVVGMIKSFQALAQGGGGDSVELSTGISEALINTAFGIGTSWLAVVSYNFFTNRIDKISFALDEIGYSLAQTYNATHADEA